MFAGILFFVDFPVILMLKSQLSHLSEVLTSSEINYGIIALPDMK